MSDDISKSQVSFDIGRRGGSITSARDVDAWAAGNVQRQLEEGAQPIQGVEHENGLAIIVLMIVTGFPIGLFTYWEWIPWGYLVSLGIWAVATAALYFMLKALPNFLSGSVMGLLLGGGAGYLGWSEAGLEWALGAGLGVGIAMFLLFYFLD